MQPHTFLYDLASIVGSVPGLHCVALELNGDGTVRVQAIDRNHSIVLDARTHEPVDGLSHNCGVADISQARAIFNAPGFNRKTMTSKWTDESVQLSSGFQDYMLGLMSEQLTRMVVAVPRLKKETFTYEATAIPTSEGLQLLKYWRREIPTIWSEHDDFTLDLSTAGNSLVATKNWGHVSTPSDKIRFLLSECSTGVLPRFLRVRSDYLARLLSFSEHTSSTLMQLSGAGLVTVEVKTTRCTYEFHVPTQTVSA